MFSLANKVAVVTGGASGIGEAIATQFLEAGATVYSIDLVESSPAGVKALVGDVSKEADILRLLGEVAAIDGHIDILVNNAGIQPLGIPFSKLTEETLRRTFEVNVHGVTFGVKHGPTFMPKTGGRIINTTSFVGMIGIPLGSAYAVSKAAVAQITKCAAIELAVKRITVNAIAPGTVLTPFVTNIPDNPEVPFVAKRTPLGRLAQPQEIATAFHFLASDEAAYITGAILPVDGGITAGWESYDLPPPDPNVTAV
ncbi:MAG: SDR family oxidoreductase [Leptolyngbya sp. SIO3F4]|nr:SDR family oxidoreductase [Leptolyngbya sp. SIO3F4]